jgi:hypothetical protein
MEITTLFQLEGGDGRIKEQEEGSRLQPQKKKRLRVCSIKTNSIEQTLSRYM